MNLIHRFMILILLYSLSFLVYADETGYEVELIIFEDTSNRYLHSEDWSYNDKLNKKDNQPKKSLTPEIDTEYEELNWEESKLTTEYNRIKNNRHYRILATKRWKQTGLDRKHAFNIPINIQTDENTLTNLTDDQSAMLSDDQVDNVSEINQIDVLTSPIPTESFITGYVKLIMSRYLHFNIDLEYVKPQSIEIDQNENSDPVIAENESFSNLEDLSLKIPIVNERRMRSREVHYIDHPLVGVIVLATPYKIKSQDIEPEQPTTYKTM